MGIQNTVRYEVNMETGSVYLRKYSHEEAYTNTVRSSTGRACVNNSWNNIGMLLRKWKAR